MDQSTRDETDAERLDREDRERLDRGVRWFYIGTFLLVAFGGISALFRVL